MTTNAVPKLTPAQIALLRLIADGKVTNFGGAVYYASINGHLRRVVKRIRTLDDLGLINPYGLAMRSGRPKRSEEQFADYHVVTLTDAGRQVLADQSTGVPA